MADLATPTPFGLREVILFPFLDAQGTQIDTSPSAGVKLNYSQTFSFADTEDSVELRGDDDQVTEHGNGAKVNWSLEAGGISLDAWSIFTGGNIIEQGTEGNRTVTLRKCSDDARPFFRVVGRILSDFGGDVKGIVYRAKCNGDVSGQFADGQFFVSSADGVGLAIPGSRLLYDIVYSEAKTAISTTAFATPTKTGGGSWSDVLGDGEGEGEGEGES